MYTMRMPLGAWGSQKKMTDFLKLELPMVVSFYVGTWNQTRVSSAKATNALNC